jgi:nicotinate-nucleotide pyrophosphorylase (carboxylating)
MAYAKYFLSGGKPRINSCALRSLINRALAEDIGRGDITTQLTIPKHKKIKVEIVAKENFILCGIDVAKCVFKSVDPSINFYKKAQDGKDVKNK